jgi:hypothetical protein
MPISRINTLAACQCWQNNSSGMPMARRYSVLTIGSLPKKNSSTAIIFLWHDAVCIFFVLTAGRK